jgi:hypothetical protein
MMVAPHGLRWIGGRIRGLLLAVCLAVLVAGCGGGELSMADYGDEIEDLLATMNGKIDALDVEERSGPSTLESTQTFWETKVVARREFIAGMESIEPPDEAADMHAAAIGIVDRLAAADEAVAQLVGTMETSADLDGLLQSSEFLATEAVDIEAVALCQAAQAEFDSTADREVFGDTPWIPSELREVVSVAFGCTKEERGVTP